jgi:Protein of unknown function C-terminus (DUF2399)
MSIVKKERRTQSTVWYLSLPLFEKYKTKLPDRRSFTGKIKAVCEKLGVTREELGIVAKARASMYFEGVKSDVSYDAIDELAKNGTDIVFIEKEAVSQVLWEYADKYAIALVDTEGFLTDYGRDLIEAAEASGANVAILSDYDASGIKLAHDAGDIPRLGVDQEMLDYFGLDREDTTVSVPFSAKIDIITRISDLVSADTLQFLKRRKIEIDAVLAAVGSERFWEYLIHKLKDYYPTRDYTRVISPTPEVSTYFPESIKDIQSRLGKYTDLILDDEEEKVTNELSGFEGFIEDVGKRRLEIDERYQEITEKDEILKELDKIATKIKPLLDKLDKSTQELTEQRQKKRGGVGK